MEADKKGWLCRWEAHRDKIEQGWLPKSMRLWSGTEAELTPTIQSFIRDWSNRIQNEMLMWSRGGAPEAVPFDGTWRGLVNTYQTDQDSTFRKLRYRTRDTYNTLMSKTLKTVFLNEAGIETTIGETLIADTKARHFLRWHEQWLVNHKGKPKVTVARGCVTMMRILVNFGATILEDFACKDAAFNLSKMKFQGAKPRGVFLTAEHVEDIINVAFEEEAPSMALAQATQFDGILRQRDIIGEWVPLAEPGISYVLNGSEKCLRGIFWEEIDQNLTLRHITSKRGKEVIIPLGSAPFVVRVLMKIYGTIDRSKLPAKGPFIVDEKTGLPYQVWRFRQQWRRIATAAGVPKEIRNMDSRAGAITEASESGAPMEHIKHAATHSQMQQTEQYARNPEAKTANVLHMRAASRNRPKT
jgi:hypothetical protein